ncbi:APC family permease [Antribacter gilvus]|uniref:APC family permease n=1 Tax=Antribacter gilvus TaxID=2304675 RepID=UPI0013E08319|nr:APC family permease [Antribacter gilvus]
MRIAAPVLGAIAGAFGSVAIDQIPEGATFWDVAVNPGLWLCIVGALLVSVAFEPWSGQRRARERAAHEVEKPAEGAGSGPGTDQQTGPATSRGPAAENPVSPSPPPSGDRERLTLLEVFGLAVGGVIGSGWLLAAPQVQQDLGRYALPGWLVGGALMAVVAVVMVEFGLASRRTGGLLFHPQDAFGPLVVVVLAGALWISYAVNPAAQAAAAVRSTATWLPDAGLTSGQNALTQGGGLLAVVVMAAIVASNLLPRKALLRSSVAIMGTKVVVLVMVVVLLWLALGDGRTSSASEGTPSNLMGGLLASGIIYAYIGFQAPLDVTDEVRRGGMGVRARVRWAVYGTVAGSYVLYSLLQHVHDAHDAQGTVEPGRSTGTPYAVLADHATIGDLSLAWLAPAVHLVGVLAPIGSGIVFTYALAREVFALSGERYAPSALQARWASRLPGRTEDTFWLILVVNFVLGLVLLATVAGDWRLLTALNTTPILVVYAVFCVVYVVRAPELPPSVWRNVLSVAAVLGFVGIAFVVAESEWAHVWRGMAVVGGGTVVLLVLPWLAALGVRGFGWFDAKDRMVHFRSRRGRLDDALPPFLALVGYLMALTALCAVRAADVCRYQPGWTCDHPVPLSPGMETLLRLATAGVALVAFGLLVVLGRRHLASQAGPSQPTDGLSQPASRS